MNHPKENNSFKTAEEILKKHVETFREDFNYEDDVLKAMNEYASQFKEHTQQQAVTVTWPSERTIQEMAWDYSTFDQAAATWVEGFKAAINYAKQNQTEK